jgi:aryl-alcohol dehydrogenase-like predicted oxidoreductase
VERRALGRSGLEVSRIVLGCGNFGGIGSAPEFFGHGESRDEAFAILDAARDAGIGALDTAASYGGGRSERWIGEWLADRAAAGTLVSTKVFHSVVGDADDHGLAPDRIVRELDGSLERLGLDRVDMYLTHAPDPETPIEDTLRALDGLVQAGKVGAVGASNVDRSELADALTASAEHRVGRFEWVQNAYSLLDRSAEREVIPLCSWHGLGFTPFSPLAGGLLTGKYRRGESPPPESRMALRPTPGVDLDDDALHDGLERFRRAAEERGVEPATLAVAWVLSHPLVTAVVVGPRRPEHLRTALAALELELSGDERDELGALFDAA